MRGNKMERYFMVSESELKELLADSLRLIALENGGVDNWDWYGDSINNYLARECGPEDDSFDDLAERLLNDYPEIES